MLPHTEPPDGPLAEPGTPAGAVLFVTFAGLLVAAGVVGLFSHLTATVLVLAVVAWAAYRTAPWGAVAALVMGWLFLDGFVWHSDGQLGAVPHPDLRLVLLLVAATVAAQLARALVGRARRAGRRASGGPA